MGLARRWLDRTHRFDRIFPTPLRAAIEVSILAFTEFGKIHPTNTHRRVFTASTSVTGARSVRMDRDSETLTPLCMTLSFVVYTPFGCEIPCYRVTAFDRSGLDSGHAPAFFVGALNLITRRVHLVDPGSSLCRVSPTIIGRRSVEARANLCRVVVCLLLPRLSSELDASRH